MDSFPFLCDAPTDKITRNMARKKYHKILTKSVTREKKSLAEMKMAQMYF